MKDRLCNGCREGLKTNCSTERLTWLNLHTKNRVVSFKNDLAFEIGWGERRGK